MLYVLEVVANQQAFAGLVTAPQDVSALKAVVAALVCAQRVLVYSAVSSFLDTVEH